MSKDSLLFLTKEDFDHLQLPRGLRDIILFELQKGSFFLFLLISYLETNSKLTPIIQQISNLNVQSTIEDHQTSIEQEKLKFEEENQPVNFQITNQKELATSNSLNSEIENIVELRGFVDDILTFEEALEVLSIEGARHEITFKRGNIHYFENSKLLKDKRIICAQTNQNKLRLAPKNTDSKKESLDQIKQLKAPEMLKVVQSITNFLSIKKTVKCRSINALKLTIILSYFQEHNSAND